MFSIDDVREKAYADGTYVNVLYYPAINEYNGKRKLQIVINSVKPVL